MKKKVIGYHCSDGFFYCLKHAFDVEEAVFEDQHEKCSVCGVVFDPVEPISNKES